MTSIYSDTKETISISLRILLPKIGYLVIGELLIDWEILRQLILLYLLLSLPL